MNSTRNINYLIAKNMISVPGNEADENEIENFIFKYKEIINSVAMYMPRCMASIAAAVAKCAIQYDKDRAISFIKNSKERIFQGKEDPVYHFYMWLHGLKGPKRKKDISTYEITMYACKQYCYGKQIKRLLRHKDRVRWSKDWELIQNNSTKLDLMSKSKNKKKEVNKDITVEQAIIEFIKKLKDENISTNDFIAALNLNKEKQLPSP